MKSIVKTAGLTLIELLVGLAIGMMLMALATTALLHVQNGVQRSRALTGLANQADVVDRTLADALGGIHPGCALRAVVDPGLDGALGTGDERITLTWMTSQPSRKEASWNMAQDHRTDLVWCRLSWRGAGVDAQQLHFATNSPIRRGAISAQGGPATIEIFPQPRRDHRRPMDDNDLRLIPGGTSGAVLGDDSDLESRLRPLHPGSYAVADLRLGWTDRDGRRVTISRNGISVQDASGSVVSGLGTSQEVAIDGIPLDGGAPLIDGTSITAVGARPHVMRIGLRLIDQRRVSTSEPEQISPEYRFSYAVDPVQGHP